MVIERHGAITRGAPMNVRPQVLGIPILIGLAASSAFAQSERPLPDRQFLFSVSTMPTDVKHATVNVDSGFGARAFDVTDSDRPEHRVGVQVALGHRLTFLGRVGLSSDDRDVRSSQQGELLFSVLESPRQQGSVALGLGMRHESGGTNVLLGRLAAGRSIADWRVDGNALFEKPFATERDAVDLITSVGVSRHVLSFLRAGVELIGEDLEGFWEEDEAEGGARVLIGPSIHIAPANEHWQIGVAGGPMLHATRSSRSSDAVRGLPAATTDRSYAVRVSMSYEF
jgi:hypothetical protein